MENRIRYYLDFADRIVGIGGPWDEFAQENNGQKVFSSDVCGRSLFDFINGESTKMWCRTILELARLQKRPIHREYRCDSPGVQRFMRMHIHPYQETGLMVEHEVVDVIDKDAAVSIVHKSQTLSASYHIRCSVCGQVEYEGAFREPSVIMAGEDGMIAVIYSVCPRCKNKRS